MNHDMNKRILLRSENYILRKYRLWFFGLSTFLLGTFLYFDKKKQNRKVNLKSEIQKLKEKTEKNNKFYEPST